MCHPRAAARIHVAAPDLRSRVEVGTVDGRALRVGDPEHVRFQAEGGEVRHWFALEDAVGRPMQRITGWSGRCRCRHRQYSRCCSARRRPPRPGHVAPRRRSGSQDRRPGRYTVSARRASGCT